MRQQGKLYNGDGEMIAEGPCEFNDEGSHVSMWPTLEKGLFERERGLMTLELEGGTALLISEQRLKLRINPPDGPRTAIYRMRVEHLPPDAGDQPPSEETESVPAHLRRTDAPAPAEDGPALDEGQAGLSGDLSTAP